MSQYITNTSSILQGKRIFTYAYIRRIQPKVKEWQDYFKDKISVKREMNLGGS